VHTPSGSAVAIITIIINTNIINTNIINTNIIIRIPWISPFAPRGPCRKEPGSLARK
jgi:hypothetical protein